LHILLGAHLSSFFHRALPGRLASANTEFWMIMSL